MIHGPGIGSFAIVLLVVGCSIPKQAPVPVSAPGLTLVPAAQGLDVAGSGGREIGFGRDRRGVLESVTRIEGRPPVPTPCGTRDGYETASGFTLIFDDLRRFVGWQRDATGAGVPCG